MFTLHKQPQGWVVRARDLHTGVSWRVHGGQLAAPMTPQQLLQAALAICLDAPYHETNAAAEPADEPNSTTAPGLLALVRRLSPDQALTLVNTKKVPGGWFVGVGACKTPHDNKPALLIRVTDEDHRVFWSFIVRALPAKYMVQFLGVGRRDHLRPDATKDAAWRVVRNGDLGALDMPAEALLSRAIQAAVDYVRRNEDRPEFVSIVKAAAEPPKDKPGAGDATRALLQSSNGLRSRVGQTIDAGDYVVKISKVSDLRAELVVYSKQHGPNLNRVIAFINVGQTGPRAVFALPMQNRNVELEGSTPGAVLQHAVQLLVARWKSRYGHVAHAAAEPAKDAEALWGSVKASLKGLKSEILESNGHKMSVYILSDGALFADTIIKPDEAAITVTLAPSTPDNLVLEFKGATFAAGRSRHSTQHKSFSTRNETTATLRKKILAELFNTLVSNIQTMREHMKAAR